MGKPIPITRIELSAAELRDQAVKTSDGAVVRRLLGIALVLEGHSREQAAKAVGMDRQTLCDWIHRYNASGVAGLASRSSPGRPPALNEAQMQELKALVLAGPDPKRHQVVRWRCIDLRDEIAARWSVRLNERTIGKLLRRLEMTRLQPRPFHPQKDAAAETAFKQNFLALVKEAVPAAAAGKPIEVWFQDEARVGQKGTLEYVWGPIGSRPPAVRDNRHDSALMSAFKGEVAVFLPARLGLASRR